MRLFALMFILSLTIVLPAAAVPLNSEAYDFAERMAEKHGFDKEYILQKIAAAEYEEHSLELMDRQAEASTWGDYKKRMITDARIKRGVKFYKDYPNTLGRAYRKYGVTPEIIVAILGVESNYGDYQLPHSAIDVLSTLAFYYPRRSDFFMGELANLFLFCKDNETDLNDIKSSYAGAVGIPQFMPSSIMNYAVDFGGDGKIDLINSKPDAIGSIAGYLKMHGWKKNEPVAVKVYVKGKAYKQILGKATTPKYSVSYMKQKGVHFSKWVNPEQKGALVSLKGEKGTEYWVVFENFHAITKYNNSINYALTVTILSKHIEIQRKRG
jgi:membrane-bound lytic murein transglycosylase B